MKKYNKALAMFTASMLAITPMAAAGMTVFAEGETTYSINIESAIAGQHTYKAYKIFSGTLSGAGTEGDPYILTEIEWGDGIDGSGLLAALKLDDAFLIDHDDKPETAKVNAFASAENAKDVAKVLENYNNDSPFAIAFAKCAGNHLSNVSHTATGSDSSNKNFEIDELEAGYYLVRDEMNITAGNPRTLNLLKVVGNVEVKTKEDLPTLDKKITSSHQNGDGTANTAAIGDIVDYQITSKVPDMKGYEKYFFVVNDTMENGLTFNSASVAIKIMNGNTSVKELVANTDYVVQTGDAADGNTFQIVFKNFIQYNSATYIGKDIVIDYSAEVNEKATTGGTTEDANTNTANLTYSNNPNVKSEGKSTDEPDEPKPPTSGEPGEPGDPVGVTPDKITYTYLTDIVIEKVDKADKTKKLSGAEFKLSGESIKATYYQEQMFVKSNGANAKYYLLKDGTYTDTAPGGSIANEKYVSTTQKYELVEESSQIDNTNKVTAIGVTASETGRLTFSGLGTGTFRLLETKAPEGGYNKLSEPVTITISATPTATGCTWTYTPTNNFVGNVITIENAKGSTLPSTGGIGTKLFYIIGGLLVSGSLVLLVTKKRMGAKEN